MHRFQNKHLYFCSNWKSIPHDLTTFKKLINQPNSTLYVQYLKLSKFDWLFFVVIGAKSFFCRFVDFFLKLLTQVNFKLWRQRFAFSQISHHAEKKRNMFSEKWLLPKNGLRVDHHFLQNAIFFWDQADAQYVIAFLAWLR